MLKPENQLPSEVLAALPIFPLPNVVLLPGMVLPLNVFEPRYLELVDHIRGGAGYLGIPLLRPGYEADYAGRPPIEEIFGVGRLIAHQRLPDGRRLIRVEGLGRVRLGHELPPRRAFREVAVTPLHEPPPRDLNALALLRAQIERLIELIPTDGEQLRTLLSIADPRVLAYALIASLPAIEALADAPGDCSALQHIQRGLDAETVDDRVQRLIERSGRALSLLARGTQSRLH